MTKHSTQTNLNLFGCAVRAIILFCGLAFPVASSAQEFVMKFSTQTINDVHQEFMREYKAALETATNNRIRVDIYTGAQLGAGPRQTEGLRLGTIEAAIGPAELFVGADPRFQGLALAGLFKDEAHARRALLVPAVRQAIADVAASRNLLLLGVNLYALQSFAFKEPVSKLADFSGKRIRVLASEGEQDSVRALGGSPVPMALPEVLAALQQGILDGANGAIPVYSAFRYYDTAPNLLDTHLWAIVSISLVNKTWYNRLPPDLQSAVVDAASKVEPEVNKWSLTRAAADLKTWTSSGGKIVTLSPAEQDEAVRRTTNAVQPLLDKNPALKDFYEKVKAGAQTVAN